MGLFFFCKACESNVSHDQKSHVTQHLKTRLHLRIAELTRSKVQTSIQYPSDNRSHRWGAALVKAGIPLHKLENSEFRKFIEGEVGYKLPSETSLKKTYHLGQKIFILFLMKQKIVIFKVSLPF